MIILCMNASQHLTRNHDRIVQILDAGERAGWRVEAILEEDGSTDDTGRIVDRFADSDKRVRGLHFRERRGKGGGLVAAARAAKGRYLVMVDADVPLGEDAFVDVIECLDSGSDVALPSRRHPASIVERLPFTRRVASKTFNVLANRLLGLDVSDTQCGVKGFRRAAFEIAMPRLFHGYEMDLEILARARRAGLAIQEIPIHYRHSPEGGFSVFRDGPKMLLRLLKIRRALGAGLLDHADEAHSGRQ